MPIFLFSHFPCFAHHLCRIWVFLSFKGLKTFFFFFRCNQKRREPGKTKDTHFSSFYSFARSASANGEQPLFAELLSILRGLQMESTNGMSQLIAWAWMQRLLLLLLLCVFLAKERKKCPANKTHVRHTFILPPLLFLHCPHCLTAHSET